MVPLTMGQIPRREGLAQSWQFCIPGTLWSVPVGREIDSGLAHVVLKADESQDLSSASWWLRRTNGGIPACPKGLNTRKPIV